LELKQLQYFYAVAKHENFSLAAEELFVAQSALSKSIQKLESELGAQLFIRNSRNVHLSPAGLELQSRLRSLLPAVLDLKPIIQDFEEDYSHSLRLSILASSTNVKDLIAEFAANYPNVCITMNRSEDYMDYDLKFSYGSYDPDREYSILLKEHEFYLLISSKHPLAKRDNVNFSELADTPHILNISTYNVSVRIQQAIRDSKVELWERFRILDNDLLCHMVELGLGFSVSPELPQLFSKYDIAVVPLENHSIKSPLYLSWTKSQYLTRAARHFIRHVCSYFDLDADAELARLGL
jgi:DNA-binding transcriptional LysR family regulator